MNARKRDRMATFAVILLGDPHTGDRRLQDCLRQAVNMVSYWAPPALNDLPLLLSLWFAAFCARVRWTAPSKHTLDTCPPVIPRPFSKRQHIKSK